MREMRSVMLAVVMLIAAGPVVAGDASPTEPVPALLGPGRVGPPPPGERIVLPPTVPKTTSALVDACVEAAMVRQDTPGVAVAVMDGGEMILERGYGVKRRDGSDPVGTDTRFRIGSVTKMFTAAAVMQQVEAGAVSLDDPVTEAVPDLVLDGVWPADWITVRNLLTHSSGYPDNFVSVNGATTDEALGNWVTTQSFARLHAPPGSFWNYSNPNFSLAGLVVERATGIPYIQYMEERVFAAAGLEHTTFSTGAVVASGDWSYGHYDVGPGPEQIYRPDSYDNWAMAPAGFAFSTAGDLVEWALILMDGGDVLSAASATEMQQPWVDIAVMPYDDYGYGIFNEVYDGLELRQHGGNVPGWGTYLLWVPERRAAVAVLANTFQSLPDAAYCIVDSIFGTPGGEALDLSPDPDLWSRFVGRYAGRDSIGVALDMEVAVAGDGSDGLTVDVINPRNPADHLLKPLVPIFWNTFAADLDNDGELETDLTFHLSDGEPNRVEWLVNRSWVGARVVAPRASGGRNGR